MGRKKCSYVLLSFFFLFWVISFEKFWRSEHKLLKLAIKRTWKKNKAFLKISKIHLVIWQMLVKKLMCFDLAAAVLFIMMEQRIYIFMTNFLKDSLSAWLHFFKDNLHYFHERIHFPKNDCYGNGKNVNFSVIIAMVAARKKNLQKLETCRFKPPL